MIMKHSPAAVRRPRVVVNIPILNEIAIIEKLVTRVTAALEGYDYVLLIVDDGSKDGTLEYVEKAVAASRGRIALLKRKKTRTGCQRGAALLAGLKWALANGDFDIFVEMDGDLSHVPEELPQGIDVIARGETDIAIASKYIPGSVTTGRSAGRTMISVICNAAVRTAIRWSIKDFSNGYRFYNRAAAELIPPYEIRYGSPIYLTEVMAIWLTHQMRIREIPGHYVGRNEGLSKVRIIDYIKAGIGVGEIALRYRVTGFQRTTQEVIAAPDERPVARASGGATRER